MMQSVSVETAAGAPAGRTVGREGSVLLVYSEQKKKHYIIVKPSCR
jgi:hypothetical protein